MDDVKTTPYRLLACDLDGTLVGDDTVISRRVQQALAAAQERGIYVTLATGRGFPETLPFAGSLNITVPIICYQGGLIKHPMTGELLYRATMKRKLVSEVIDLARTHEWHLVVYVDNSVFVEELRHAHSLYKDLLGLNFHCVNDLARAIDEHDSDPAKFLIVAAEAECDRIQTEMRARFGHQMDIVRSHLLFVEGSPRGVNKGHALHWLAEHLNVPQAQVMAIGDQDNDVPMLAWAGLGVAMGNGSEATRAAADWIAPPFLADGAAVAIERFLLS